MQFRSNVPNEQDSEPYEPFEPYELYAILKTGAWYILEVWNIYNLHVGNNSFKDIGRVLAFKNIFSGFLSGV